VGPAAVLALLVAIGGRAPAQEPTPSPAARSPAPPPVSTTDVQLLATLDQPGGRDHWVVTLQHFSSWRYGTNFFFVDASAPDMHFFADGLGLYLEYAPVVSLSRVAGARVGGGPLADVGATVQINGGSTPGGFEIPRVFLEGVELAWSVPGFRAFATQLLARQERRIRPSGQLTWVYTLPFVVGPTQWVVQGFVDVWRRSQRGAPTSTVLLAQPQLLVRVAGGGGGSELQLGVELEPSHDFPSRAVHEGWRVAYSPMVRWVF
jgi:hypothetical protein